MDSKGLAAVAAAAAGAADSKQPAGQSDQGTAAQGTPAAKPPAADTSGARAEGQQAGVAAERARVAAIIGAPEAKGREALAQHLAFSTDMSAEAAIGVLKASPEAKPASRLDEAMKGHAPKVEIGEGGDAAASRKAGLSAAVTRALAKLGKQPSVH